jgi:hypothetical protein
MFSNWPKPNFYKVLFSYARNYPIVERFNLNPDKILLSSMRNLAPPSRRSVELQIRQLGPPLRPVAVGIRCALCGWMASASRLGGRPQRRCCWIREWPSNLSRTFSTTNTLLQRRFMISSGGPCAIRPSTRCRFEGFSMGELHIDFPGTFFLTNPSSRRNCFVRLQEALSSRLRGTNARPATAALEGDAGELQERARSRRRPALRDN